MDPKCNHDDQDDQDAVQDVFVDEEGPRMSSSSMSSMSSMTAMTAMASLRKSKETRARLEGDCLALKDRLDRIRRRRDALRRAAGIETDRVRRSWSERRNESKRRRVTSYDAYRAASNRKNQTIRHLRLAESWNATNDCFLIWHRGPFGTINGLRLGSEVPVLPSSSSSATTSTSGGSDGSHRGGGTEKSTTPTSLSPFSSFTVGNGGDHYYQQQQQNGRQSKVHNSSSSSSHHHHSNLNHGSNNDAFKVSWVEINSAFGLLALLLSTLEQKPQSGIKFHNELVPMGSTSKVGIRKSEQSVTYYNLYSDDSFQFFGKRNFNMALTGLLKCLADASLAVEKRDRTIALPHAIETNAKGEMTIGGLPVTYGTDGEQWTRAMKYVLTNVKWLVAFTSKHVDR